ncbi:MAG: hypothetical protein GXP26_11650 [Planctomycetes bacterium]|nr:hypothetical protein [Planctomycetota bacterium]
MSTFDLSRYGPAFAELLQCDRLRSLDEGTPDDGCREQLDSLTVQAAFAHVQVLDEEMARCCISGVWLLHDFLSTSHTISQGITTPSGSYWHGIMHRREGDFSNAKYWFHKVGDHPIFEQLTEAVEPLGGEPLLGAGGWNPFAFIDACQAAVSTADADADICRSLQQREWELLFDYCYVAAIAVL